MFWDPASENVTIRDAVAVTQFIGASGFHPCIYRVVERIRDVLSVPTANRERSKHLFVSRQHGITGTTRPRALLNEEEVVAVCREFVPVEYINPSHLKWREQIALFSESTSTIGEYSSGMHNMVFAPPDATVTCSGFVNHVQSQIASLCGHDAAYYDSPTVGEFTIDLDHLRRFLERRFQRQVNAVHLRSISPLVGRPPPCSSSPSPRLATS